MADPQFIIQVTDCIKAMRMMPDESVDLVVTSPPYNIGVPYKGYRDKLPKGKYLKWTGAWTTEVIRLLKPNGSFFLNINSAIDPLLPFEVAIELTKQGLRLQNTFHWIKSITVEEVNGDLTSVGPYKPLFCNHYVSRNHEFIFHFTRSGKVPLDKYAVGVPFKCPENIDRFNGRTLRDRGNIWYIPYQANYTRRLKHPAPFPIRLPEWCIKIHGRNNELVVLDPFLGSGSSAVAAERCQVARFIGFDICQQYVETAKLRLNYKDNR